MASTFLAAALVLLNTVGHKIIAAVLASVLSFCYAAVLHLCVNSSSFSMMSWCDCAGCEQI